MLLCYYTTSHYTGGRQGGAPPRVEVPARARLQLRPAGDP